MVQPLSRLPVFDLVDLPNERLADNHQAVKPLTLEFIGLAEYYIANGKRKSTTNSVKGILPIFQCFGIHILRDPLPINLRYLQTFEAGIEAIDQRRWGNLRQSVTRFHRICAHVDNGKLIGHEMDIQPARSGEHGLNPGRLKLLQ